MGENVKASDNRLDRTPPSSSHGRRSSQSNSPPAPMSDPQVGDIVWAKVKNSRWWPGTLVTRENCGKLGTIGGNRSMLYVYWYGDGRVSPVAKSKLVDFRQGYKIFTTSPGGNSFRNGVFQAITEFRKLQGLDGDSWNDRQAVSWAEEGFPTPHDIIRKPGCLSEYVRNKLQSLCEKYNSDDDEPLKLPSPEMDLFDNVRDGTVDLDKVCLSCVTEAEELTDHPIFDASICKQCLETFCQCAFAVGSDLVSFYCCICMKLGEMMVCSQPECFRAYCFGCIEMKATRGILNIIRDIDPWDCFLCVPYKQDMHGLLRPRTMHWKLNMWKIFHSDAFSFSELQNIPMNILCCGETYDTALSVLSILLSLGMKINALLLCGFSADDAKKLTSKVPDNTSIELLPLVCDFQDFEKLSSVTPIHMIIASSAEKEKEYLWQSFINFYSVLSRIRILNELSPQPALLPVLWVLEVSPPFRKEYNVRITRFLEFEPASWSHNTKGGESLVWTNYPAMWKFLKGSGLPNMCSNSKKGGNETAQSDKTHLVPEQRGEWDSAVGRTQSGAINQGATPTRKDKVGQMKKRKLANSDFYPVRVTRSMARKTL